MGNVPAKNLPTHEVYHVREIPEQAGLEKRGFWTKVGAMWQHKDGKGFDIVFEIQVAEPRLVAWVREEKKEAGTQEHKPRHNYLYTSAELN